MERFEGIIIQPSESWDEITLKEISDTLSDKPVTINSDFESRKVGSVEDVEYIEGDGLRCTISVTDSAVAEKIDNGLIKFAPILTKDLQELPEPPEFDSVFMTPHPTDDVGDFHRKT